MLLLSFVEEGFFLQADAIYWAGVQATIAANNNYKSGEGVIFWEKRGEIEKLDLQSADNVAIRLLLKVVFKMWHTPHQHFRFGVVYFEPYSYYLMWP